MNRVRLELTPTEAEALALFLAERLPLWRTHAIGFGVEDPDSMCRKLADGYKEAIIK